MYRSFTFFFLFGFIFCYENQIHWKEWGILNKVLIDHNKVNGVEKNTKTKRRSFYKKRVLHVKDPIIEISISHFSLQDEQHPDFWFTGCPRIWTVGGRALFIGWVAILRINPTSHVRTYKSFPRCLGCLECSIGYCLMI